MEEWREVEGYSGLYSVSSHGRVRSDRPRGNILKPNKTGGGMYYSVILSKGGKTKPYKVSRLVAFAFLEKPGWADQVNHIDGDKYNNHVSNLEWTDQSGNMQHAYKNGLVKAPNGENHWNCKMTAKKVLEMRKLRSEGMFCSKIAEMYGEKEHTVYQAVTRRSWKHLT